MTTRRQFLKTSAGALLLARGLSGTDVGRAAGETGAGSAIAHLGAYPLPKSGDRQIKFGRRVPWQHAPVDNKMYTIGGEVWQETNPAYHNGSPTLFRYDTVNHTLAVEYPYWGASGVQPSHPDGVSLGYDSINANPGIVVIPGTTLDPANLGGWQGKSSPLKDRIMKYGLVTRTWTDVAARHPHWPSPALSQNPRATIGHDYSYAVARVDGVAKLLVQDLLSWAAQLTHDLASKEFGQIDPGGLSQFYCGALTEVICFDWNSGRIIGVHADLRNVTVRGTVPRLANMREPFTMAYDPRRVSAVLFYPAGIKIVDLMRGKVTEGGPLPAGVTGFFSSAYDPVTDQIIVTGESEGASHIHHYKLPDVVAPKIIPQGAFNDTGAGATGHFFEKNCLWKWRNSVRGAGDWLDVNLVPRGDDPRSSGRAWSVARINAKNELVNWDIRNIVTWWLRNHNVGLMVRNGYDSKFWSTRHAYSKYWPVVTVVDNGITKNVPIVANIGILGESSQAAIEWLSTNQNDGSILIRCDLAGISGPITSAMLSMYCFAFYGTATAGTYLVNPPPVFEAGTKGTPTTGLADAYPWDAGRNTRKTGIGAHPSVYVASDYDVGYDEKGRMGKRAGLSRIVSTQYEEELRAVSARYQYDPYSPWASSNVVRFIEDLGLPEPTEAYFRLYVRWEKTFDPHVDGGKMGMSWDWRMNGPCGNGGNKTSGLYEPDSGVMTYSVDVASNRIIVQRPVPENSAIKFIFLTPPEGISEGAQYYAVNCTGNSFQVTKKPGEPAVSLTHQGSGRSRIWANISAPRLHFCGGSVRANFFVDYRLSEYTGYVIPFIYSYDQTMEGYYPDGVAWGDPSNGFPIFRKEKWYCMEGHLKLNTVAGPFDSLGNGYGNADGLIEWWVDGVQVFRKDNFVLHHNPKFRIQGYWNDWTHGGTQCTEAQHHFRMSNLVVANQRIGPMKKT